MNVHTAQTHQPLRNCQVSADTRRPKRFVATQMNVYTAQANQPGKMKKNHSGKVTKYSTAAKITVRMR